MPAPKLDPNVALDVLRTEIVFTAARCAASADAKDQAKKVDDLLKAWSKTASTQNELWDAQTKASALVSAADDDLDSIVVDFARDLLKEVHDDRNDPHYVQYFSVSPSDLARPVLGGELATLKGWSKLLKKEGLPTLAAYKKRLADLIARADAAVEARDEADAANLKFRKTGGLAEFFDLLESTRDKLFNTLDARRGDSKGRLPRDFASRFFRHRVTKVSDDEKAAAVAKKSADKAKRDAQAAAVKNAKAQLKAAQKALRDAEGAK